MGLQRRCPQKHKRVHAALEERLHGTQKRNLGVWDKMRVFATLQCNRIDI